MLLKVRATRNICARLFALDWIGLLVNLGSGSRGSVDMEMIHTRGTDGGGGGMQLERCHTEYWQSRIDVEDATTIMRIWDKFPHPGRPPSDLTQP